MNDTNIIYQNSKMECKYNINNKCVYPLSTLVNKRNCLYESKRVLVVTSNYWWEGLQIVTNV